MSYRLSQSFTYTYDGPASDLEHRLVVVPPARHGDQVLRTATVTVSDEKAFVHWYDDAVGNRRCLVRLADVPRRLDLTVEVTVDRRRNPRPASLTGSWDLWRLPSALTAANAEITALARDHAVSGDVLTTAEAFCSLVPQRISYGFGVTDVGTNASQALAGGTGVCQDQAHLMLALCRSVGIAARYVSGHLVGHGGTHAWVEVADAGRAVAFDPCHARRADSRYVTVAVGRDYRDVPPTSGRYNGTAHGRLTSTRLLELVDTAA